MAFEVFRDRDVLPDVLSWRELQRTARAGDLIEIELDLKRASDKRGRSGTTHGIFLGDEPGDGDVAWICDHTGPWRFPWRGVVRGRIVARFRDTLDPTGGP